MTTGQLIKAARKSAGLSQKQLGEKLGLSASMIGQWENDLRNPKYDTLQRIADALGIRFTDLMGYVCLGTIGNGLYFYGPPDDEPDFYNSPTSEDPAHSSQKSTIMQRIHAAMEQMTEEGQEKVADYAADILPRYRAEPAPASPPSPSEDTDTDTTPPADAPEGPAGASEDE